jgi:8-amino-7-oxononanoate synthase
LESLGQIKQKQPFVLVLDEAHASGVYGRNGSGLAAELGLADLVDVFVVTFSKAAGCVGGAIAAKENFCRMVMNLGRSYLYSTSLPPAIAAAIRESIGVMRDEPERQRRLRDATKDFRSRLRAAGVNVADGDSPIVPIIVGAESEALALSKSLLERRLLVGAVRPPTVPRGTSRLRLTLSSEHSASEIALLVDALIERLRE